MISSKKTAAFSHKIDWVYIRCLPTKFRHSLSNLLFKKISILKSEKGDFFFLNMGYGIWEVKALHMKCSLNAFTNVNVSIQVFPDEGRLVEIYW